MTARTKLDYDGFSDLELAAHVAERDVGAVRLVTQLNNRRLFRAAWGILRNRDEAEDAVQVTYLRGFAAITDFQGKASLSTWLTRIAINVALGRKRAMRRERAHLDDKSVLFLDHYREKLHGAASPSSPEECVTRTQLRQLLEAAIAKLPAPFRTVFILRDVEGLSVPEVADTLQIPPATVRTRHLRARRKLKQDLEPNLMDEVSGTIAFAGVDCEQMTAWVVAAYCRVQGRRPAASRARVAGRSG